MTNPLLNRDALPRFDEIRAEHVEPAMRELLVELTRELEELETKARPSWEGLFEPMERMTEKLHYSWGVVGHLMGVQNSDDLRQAHEAVQPDVVRFSMALAQSRPIYDAARELCEGVEFEALDGAQQRVVTALLRDAELAGVGLDGAERERFNEIQLELAELATQFSNHVLDATKAFSLLLRDPVEVEGLPQSALELAAQSAREEGEADAQAASGPWRITLDYPSLLPVLEHGVHRGLREQLYRAHLRRASEGELDNAPLIERILALRAEEAALLRYASYAEMSLASKMAPDVATVERLLEQLRSASRGAAEDDLRELREFAGERGETAELAHWDIAFWAQRLREARFAYSEEELRPYFPLPHVLDGLFALVERLFDVRVVAADGETPVWHPDVRFFRVLDGGGEAVAAFYLDPYSRPADKRGGAWMDECVGRSRLMAPPDRSSRLPVAYLVCNGTPPVDGRPSLMTFSEVETLFHEFGHGLQHMLTQVDCGMCAGIRNVEWDAVELPSQFMENWCYHRKTLLGLTRHYETREPLPDELFDKIRAARTYRAGSDMLRQLYFGFTDLALHSGLAPGVNAFDVQREVAEKTTVLPPLADDRFLCSFSHIFAGGYAAGYYSYKWAEVLSADAFAAFEEAGLDNETALAEIGRRYRDTVLGLGGSRAPMDVFVAFRGREPSPEALLRHSDLQ
jgi:oligopeptidase A